MSKEMKIKIYQERIPKHYVGEDISIVIKFKCDTWQAALVEDSITTILKDGNYQVESDTYPDGVIVKGGEK